MRRFYTNGRCYYANGDADLTNDLAKIQRVARVAQAFTPSAPVSRLDMLAGRADQILEVASAAAQRGRHVALYGERGVGKTSLANVLHEFFTADDLPNFQAAIVNCSTDDNYGTLWARIMAEIGIDGPNDYEIQPDGIRRVLAELDTPALIVIDELDRLEDDMALTLNADTIKALSDHAVPSTVVMVGVARSIGDLIGEHESIVRALAQVEMPRMSPNELRSALELGCAKAELTIREDAAAEIAGLSEGLPHYTHLLGLHAGQRVVQDDRTEITLVDVRAAIPRAVQGHTIDDAYQRATRSAHKDALFRHVLLACALAPKNQLGFFTAGSIRDPLALIAGRRLDIPAFSRHLSQFLESDRGSVLFREAVGKRYFYRFSDPILQPYVVLRGVSDGLLTEEQVREIQNRGLRFGGAPTDDETNEPQQLF
jgi:type II secretory pathway predicted ATPase ExeA